ncbi:packaged DNA stabilization protein (plasmid) [Arsenophonus nasoniae]|uniref:Packaged DNA stabilization protein n=1 Tax=Arsenophonus nasoniae TaxID=638 RepID=A0A4P7KRD2_9GAMM|nr:packaged DNA stabilization protein [Arsenophonus nasoniae]QBY42549.1 Phage stabilization protein [Arsenophonus nasoniae]WGM06656.1 packaged DNA stabilization protein [Arsenophonus nasoniae]WGM09088.1 packaged DNA stabilization protein [Arsenophonus nasoniae]WGM11597.1 packaged DNA stabilization protein [Arsenophonus nasoniae]WGM13749.1 packaged DNA stabilization protein [Arsenophonus nasoniae]
MPKIQIPIAKGLGKDFKTADYIDALPVNILATPKEILNAAGYLRSFPGIEKKQGVNGISRGVQFNTKNNTVYRVCGNKLYLNGKEIADILGNDRVSMSHSSNSQAVCFDGKLKFYRYDGTEKALSNWPKDKYPQYDLGEVIDVCRNRGRYIWLQKGGERFGVTDLEDESKPDRYRPFYRAESQPDGIVSVASWRDMLICFGSSTIEYFSLTGSSDTSQPIYIAQPAYMIQIGIAGRDCQCRYQDNYAIISHHSIGQPSVYIIGSGEKNKISTATIDKIMSHYSADELSTSVMESIKFDNHELLIIHLPKHTLCFDVAANNQWSILKSGFYDDPYRAIDFMFYGNQITVGDKKEGVIGHLVFNASNQYEQHAEHILYTPMIKADNARLFDFELEALTGVAQIADKLFLSATTDGINYGREQLIEQDSPFQYDKRIIWRRIGRVRKNIGFKIRIITKSPVTLSDLSLRIE